MDASTVTSKGQIVIPAKLRKKTGIKKGTKVYIEEKDGNLIVHPATTRFLEKNFGLLAGSGLVSALEQSRKSAKKREDEKLGER